MIGIVIQIAMALARLFIPAIFAEKTNTSCDAAAQPEIRKRLQKKVRSAWIAAPVLLCLLFLPGCALPFTSTRTVYIPHGEPVRIRETLHDVRVWVKDKDGKTIEGVIDLPEGWFALPLEIEEAPQSPVQNPKGDTSRLSPLAGVAPRGEDYPPAGDASTAGCKSGKCDNKEIPCHLQAISKPVRRMWNSTSTIPCWCAGYAGRRRD